MLHQDSERLSREPRLCLKKHHATLTPCLEKGAQAKPQAQLFNSTQKAYCPACVQVPAQLHLLHTLPNPQMSALLNALLSTRLQAMLLPMTINPGKACSHKAQVQALLALSCRGALPKLKRRVPQPSPHARLHARLLASSSRPLRAGRGHGDRQDEVVVAVAVELGDGAQRILRREACGPWKELRGRREGRQGSGGAAGAGRLRRLACAAPAHSVGTPLGGALTSRWMKLMNAKPRLSPAGDAGGGGWERGW